MAARRPVPPSLAPPLAPSTVYRASKRCLAMWVSSVKLVVETPPRLHEEARPQIALPERRSQVDHLRIGNRSGPAINPKSAARNLPCAPRDIARNRSWDARDG